MIVRQAIERPFCFRFMKVKWSMYFFMEVATMTVPCLTYYYNTAENDTGCRSIVHDNIIFAFRGLTSANDGYKNYMPSFQCFPDSCCLHIFVFTLHINFN